MKIRQMRSHTLILLFICLILLMPGRIQANQDQDGLARWYVNYGDYLIEVGKYAEALVCYDSAFELSDYSGIIIESMLAKANLLALYLDNPDQALEIYQAVEMKYPWTENSVYWQGMLLFDMNRAEASEQVLKRYLKKFPKGRFTFQAQAVLKKIKVKEFPKPEKVKRPDIRIRLRKNVRKTRIESVARGSEICTGSGQCGSSFIVKPSDDGLYLNGTLQKNREIEFKGNDPVRVISGKYNKGVRGSVKVILNSKRLTVINVLDIESYLLSVVPAESYAGWPLEALKAQAVAARTYAIYQAMHRKSWSYDMVDNEGDQCYGGVKQEHLRTTKAVKETAGMILTYEDRPVLAMYSANSGGYTADAGVVFGLKNKPYLIARKDPESLKGKMADWTRKYSLSYIESGLRGIGIRCKGIKAIRAYQVSTSGRVIKVKIESGSGTKIYRTWPTLRRALKLPEILFKIRKLKKSYSFEGHGYGHGVGLSQWGARFMGDKKGYKDILGFYYPNTEIVKRW